MSPTAIVNKKPTDKALDHTTGAGINPPTAPDGSEIIVISSPVPKSSDKNKQLHQPSKTSSTSQSNTKDTKSPNNSNKKFDGDISNPNIAELIKELKNTVISQAATINSKIDAKINSLEAKISVLSDSVDERIDNLTSQLPSHITPVVDTLLKPITSALESRIEKLERESMMLNLVVTGIP